MAGRIQGADIKSAAELVTAGATAASLPPDTKIYITANGINDTLFNAIQAGTLSGNHGWNFLASVTASSQATVDFSSQFTNAYNKYMVAYDSVAPATDDSFLELLLGTGGGPTFQTTNYQQEWFQVGTGGTGTGGNATGTYIPLTRDSAGSGVGSAAGRTTSGVLEISDPSATNFVMVQGRSTFIRSDGVLQQFQTSGSFANGGTAVAITGVRFKFSAGNIASGFFRLYGLAKN